MPKILFILKRRDNYNPLTDVKIGMTTGLYNSASFVNKMLNEMEINSIMEVVTDNNCIDRVVTQHKPDYCIIEALWVVPEKFSVLQKLHPNVKWIVRLHSEMPFMAGEGIALNWIGEYAKYQNVCIGINAPRMMREVGLFLKAANNWNDKEVNDKLIYLPNYYPQKYRSHKKINKNKDHIDIGCFGAVRPLKNHMNQAVAAVDFAEQKKKKLYFHVNLDRREMKGEPIAHNLEGFFAHLYDRGHRLISHQWAPREEFLDVCSQMDIGMQCSFSETFNIVGCDLLTEGVPIVGSREIPWILTGVANPTETKEITRALHSVYNFTEYHVLRNQHGLHKYTSKTARIWKKYFQK
jgi:hypothetical protein